MPALAAVVESYWTLSTLRALTDDHFPDLRAVISPYEAGMRRRGSEVAAISIESM